MDRKLLTMTRSLFLSSRNKGSLLIVAYLGSENSIYAWLLKMASFDKEYGLYYRSV